VPRRERCREFDNSSRDNRFLGIANYHMTARCSAADVEPEIVRLGDLEGQMIVVVLAATDQDLEPFEQDRAVWASLAGHYGLITWYLVDVRPAWLFGPTAAAPPPSDYCCERSAKLRRAKHERRQTRSRAPFATYQLMHATEQDINDDATANANRAA
jgi:hypothetical protein